MVLIMRTPSPPAKPGDRIPGRLRVFFVDIAPSFVALIDTAPVKPKSNDSSDSALPRQDDLALFFSAPPEKPPLRRRKTLPVDASRDIAASSDLVAALQRVMKKTGLGGAARIRAQILLAWLKGEHRDVTVARLFLSPNTVSRVRHRFWAYLQNHALTAPDADTLVADFFRTGLRNRGRPGRITAQRVAAAALALGPEATDAALARRLRCHRSTVSRFRRRR